MTDPPVTVILPTHDHAALLPFAIASVTEQSFGDLALVVIGDGVDDATRDVVADVCRRDPRVSFLDRPKALRHAEEVRDEVIGSTDSAVIAYHGDDDLLLPWHLREMLDVLGDNDFAHPLPLLVEPDGTLRYIPTDVSRPDCRDWHRDPDSVNNAVSLTGVVHSAASYRRLPAGWRTAPVGTPTDLHMWRQYFGLPDLRAVTANRATTIKLHTDRRKALSPDERVGEIEQWWRRVHATGFREQWDTNADAAVRRAAVDCQLAMSARRNQIQRVQERADSERGSASQRIRQLAAERDEARRQLASVTGSRSWRLSRPLRRAAQRLRRNR